MHTQMTGSCAYATYYLVLSNLLFHSVNNCTFDSDSVIVIYSTKYLHVISSCFGHLFAIYFGAYLF